MEGFRFRGLGLGVVVLELNLSLEGIEIQEGWKKPEDGLNSKP